MEYRKDIDSLKGIAIIAVVLYHLGLLESGFMGVDVFFVINGFLLIPSICKGIESGEFRYLAFLKKRVLRLWPLVVLASIVCLIIGYFGMLPDNYENLGESAVASVFFSENILSALTTNDYWNAVNGYKPLMHLWFVGVLFQFYLVFPLILLAFRRMVRKPAFVVAGVLVLSLALYLLNPQGVGARFYLPQYRFFEFALGGLAGMLCVPKGRESKWSLLWLAPLAFVLFSSLISGSNPGDHVYIVGKFTRVDVPLIADKSLLLLLTVLFTASLLAKDNSSSVILGNSVLPAIGRRSYSIFIWHQVVLAFWRYFISADITPGFVLGTLLAVAALSELSYRFVEMRIRPGNRPLIVWAVLALAVAGAGGYIYLRAGVVRDVPEQDVFKADIHRGMHAEYVDRIYNLDKDFPEPNGKKNVLVLGNSFSRDFANCLLESDYADSVNISYYEKWNSLPAGRIGEADYIFVFCPKRNVPMVVRKGKKPSAQVWGLGTKTFGSSNGIVYSRRFRDEYFATKIVPYKGFLELNDAWKSEWKDRYIDFIGLAMDDEGRIPVFTPYGKFISHDCEHLTRAGARWYATLIPWDEIFK